MMKVTTATLAKFLWLTSGMGICKLSLMVRFPEIAKADGVGFAVYLTIVNVIFAAWMEVVDRAEGASK